MIVQRLILMACLVLAACNQDQTKTHSSASANKPIPDCELVLLKPDNALPDAAIIRHQQSIKQNHQPLVNLEKLGWAYIAQARNHFDNGYYQMALKTASCIEQRISGNNEALLLKAYVKHQLHQFKQAEILARKLIEQRGSWFEYGLLGDALMEQGKLVMAEHAYQEMMNQRPGPQAYSRSAHLRWLKGDLPGAIEMMSLAVKSHGGRNDETAAWAQTRLGFYLFAAKEFTAANQIINLTLRSFNNYPPALFLQGRLQLSKNNPQQAIEVISKAININPLPEYQWLLIDVLKLTGKFEQAFERRQQFMTSAAMEDPRTYSLFLATEQNKNKLSLKLANEELDKRQDIFSQDAMAWSLYADAQIDQALIYMKKALAAGTRDARLFYHAAVIHKTAGNVSQALQWFNKAMTNQHMLIPSELQFLMKEFAAHTSYNQAFESELPKPKINFLN